MSNGYFPSYTGFGDPVNSNVYATTTETLKYKNETGDLTTEIPIPEGMDIENKESIVLFKEDASTGKTSIIPEDDFLIDYNNDKIILLNPIDVDDIITGKVFSSIDVDNLGIQTLTDISNTEPEHGETLRWDETISKYVPSTVSVRSITDNINKVIDTSGGSVTEILMEPGFTLSENTKPIIVIDGVPAANSIIQSIEVDRVILKPANAIPQGAVAEIMILDTKDIPDQSVRDIVDWADIAPTNDQLPLWDGVQYTPVDNDLAINTDVEKVGVFEEGQILVGNSSGKFTNLSLSTLITEIMILDTKDIPDQSVRDIVDWADIAPTNDQLPLWDGVQYTPVDNDLAINTDVEKVGVFEEGQILVGNSSGKFTNLSLSTLITEIAESVQGAILSIEDIKEGQTLVSRGKYFVNEYHNAEEKENYKNIDLVTPPTEGTYIPITDSVYIPPIKALIHQYTINNYFTVESTTGQLTDGKYALIFIDGMLQFTGFELPSKYKDTDLYKISLTDDEVDFTFIENADIISIQGFFSEKYTITPTVLSHTKSVESDNILLTGTFDVTDVYLTFVNGIHQIYSDVTPLIIGSDLQLTFTSDIPVGIDIKVIQLPLMSANIEIDELPILPAQTEFVLTTVPNIDSHLIVFDGGYYLDPMYYHIQASNNKLKITADLVSGELVVYHFLNVN